jgi:DNA polymerase-4
MARDLESMGIRTIGQLQALPRAVLRQRFGRHGERLAELAVGRDDRPVTPDASARSIGAEETFGRDCRDGQKLATTLRGQAERVAAALRRERLSAARLTLKLRFADFRTLTRCSTGDPTQDGLEIYRRAAALLERIPRSQAVRLIGISASGLPGGGQGQLSLLDHAMVRRERLARAVDGLTRRFGEGTVRPASLLEGTPGR